MLDLDEMIRESLNTDAEDFARSMRDPVRRIRRRAHGRRLMKFSAVVVVVALVAAGGAEAIRRIHSPAPPTENVSINWNRYGTSLKSVDEAAGYLLFRPYVPRNLGSPRAIRLDLRVPIHDRLLTFVYEDASLGQVVVNEIKMYGNVAKFIADERGSMNDLNRYGRGGHTDEVRIRGGTVAFVATASNGKSIFVIWADSSGVEFIVRAPTLTKDQALAIANGL